MPSVCVVVPYGMRLGAGDSARCTLLGGSRRRRAEDGGAFGCIDILINNTSAIQMTGTLKTPARRFDLLFGVNVRGTFLCSQVCVPFQAKSANLHILNLAPPLSMKPQWFKDHVAYTMPKYGMCMLGMAEEFHTKGIAVNALWLRTTLATAAIEVNFPREILEASRKPDIMAYTAYAIFWRDNRAATGNFYIDEDVPHAEGVTDFEAYAVTPGAGLFTDFFLDV